MKNSSTKSEQEFKVSGKDLKARVKKLIEEGNARKIVIKNEKGNSVLEIPLTWGAVGVVLAPALAAVGAIAALLTNYTIVVIKK